eukprot:1157430-Pelagomonas_calceolata.AAC.4
MQEQKKKWNAFHLGVLCGHTYPMVTMVSPITSRCMLVFKYSLNHLEGQNRLRQTPSSCAHTPIE